MAGEIKTENGNLFIIKSLRRKCHSKSKCHSVGDLQMQHQKDKWKQSVSEPGKGCPANHKHLQLSSSPLSLHIVLRHWTGCTSGHLIQVHPLFHAALSCYIQFKVRHGHEHFKNDTPQSVKTQHDLMPDFCHDFMIIYHTPIQLFLSWYIVESQCWQIPKLEICKAHTAEHTMNECKCISIKNKPGNSQVLT